MAEQVKKMDTKTKVFTVLTIIALDIAFIGYYFALYNGNKNNVLTYTTLIIIVACGNGVLFGKQKSENKVLNTLAKLNVALFVIWVITVIIQLFM